MDPRWLQTLINPDSAFGDDKVCSWLDKTGRTWAVATNGITMIAVAGIEGEHSTEQQVKYDRFFAKLPAPTLTITNFAAFKVWVGVTPWTYCEHCQGVGTIECPACHGDGFTECHACGHEVDCERCKATGVLPCWACGKPKKPTMLHSKRIGEVAGLALNLDLLAKCIACMEESKPVTIGTNDKTFVLYGDGWFFVLASIKLHDAQDQPELKWTELQPCV